MGMQVKNEIEKLNTVYENVRVDYYCIMPDHVHMIISILPPDDLFVNNERRPQVAPTSITAIQKSEDGKSSEVVSDSPSLSRIIQQFKGAVTKRVGCPIWQKSFFDRIIRNKTHYLAARDYIASNPVRRTYDNGDPSDFENWLSSRT